MNREFFCITKKTPIILYGCNHISTRKYNDMKGKGYQVVGVADANADSINTDGMPMHYLEDYLVSGIIPDQVVVIICLQNGRKHEEFAGTISKYGIKNIIYLPTSFDNSIEDLHVHRKQYSYFMMGYYSQLQNCPRYKDNDHSLGQGIIDNYSDAISFWCPIGYLFSPTLNRTIEECGITPTDKKEAEKYCDIPITNLETYYELFRYLETGEQDNYPEAYLRQKELFRSIDRNRYLIDRRNLIETYEKHLKYDPSFFLDSPAECIYENDRLYVIDGTHRTCYLIYKGYKLVPIVLNREQYDLFSIESVEI